MPGRFTALKVKVYQRHQMQWCVDCDYCNLQARSPDRPNLLGRRLPIYLSTEVYILMRKCNGGKVKVDRNTNTKNKNKTFMRLLTGMVLKLLFASQFFSLQMSIQIIETVFRRACLPTPPSQPGFWTSKTLCMALFTTLLCTDIAKIGGCPALVNGVFIGVKLI